MLEIVTSRGNRDVGDVTLRQNGEFGDCDLETES